MVAPILAAGGQAIGTVARAAVQTASTALETGMKATAAAARSVTGAAVSSGRSVSRISRPAAQLSRPARGGGLMAQAREVSTFRQVQPSMPKGLTKGPANSGLESGVLQHMFDAMKGQESGR